MSLRKYLKQAKRQRLVAEIRFKNGAVAANVLIVEVGDKHVCFQWLDERGRLIETPAPLKEIDKLSLVRLERALGEKHTGWTGILPAFRPEEQVERKR